MNTSKIWDFIASNIISLATVFLGLLVIALDQIGILSSSTISSTIIALLALIATSQIVENKRDFTKLEESVEAVSKQLVETLRGIKATTFTSDDEYFEFSAKCYKEARYSIDQAALDIRRSRDTSAKIRDNKSRESVILADRVKFRYVAVLHSTDRLERCKKYVLDMQLKKFFAGLYPKPNSKLPLLSFAVIDNEIVLGRFPSEAGQDSGYIVIQSPQVTKLFAGYFNKLWNDAKKLETEDDYHQLKMEHGQ